MADISETEKTEKTPLLKQKKTRPPQSEKQMQNFRAMQEIRAKKAEARKQDKILEAQRALLQKEGYIKATPKAEPIQFEIEEKEEEEDQPVEEVIVKPKIKAIPKIKEIQTPKVQRRKVIPKVIEPESEEGDSDSSDEVIIIKRKSKKGALKRTAKPIEDEEDFVSNTPHIDYSGFFC